jgi:hypothetical protein
MHFPHAVSEDKRSRRIHHASVDLVVLAVARDSSLGMQAREKVLLGGAFQKYTELLLLGYFAVSPLHAG